jgi:hypothetical protein
MYIIFFSLPFYLKNLKNKIKSINKKLEIIEINQ